MSEKVVPIREAARLKAEAEARQHDAPPPDTPSLDDLPKELASLIRDGLDQDGNRPEDHSRALFCVVCRLRERGWSAESIARLLGRHPNGVGGQFQGQVSDEVRNCFDKAHGPIGLDKQQLTVDDFFAFSPKRTYIFAPAGDFWPREATDLRCEPVPVKAKEKPLPASIWLDLNKTVEQITWAPGEPQVVAHRLVSQGGWIKRPGCHVFNLYLPPQRQPGDPRKAAPWLRHLLRIYGKEQARHIVGFMAHRIQKPGDKINHGLVLGGAQGIGKDTLLEPVKHGVGPWNFKDISPPVLLGRFNGFVKAVVLRISEARDLGDINRYSFYEHTKVLMAAPPDVINCDEKNIREHPVFNICGVIMTTNYKEGGIYLPLDDRRHFVAWSDAEKDEFSEAYWEQLWGWYQTGGIWNVVAYLEAYNLGHKKKGFNPKAPPPKTEAWWAIVTSSMAPEDAELNDVLDAMGRPKVTTLAEIAYAAVTAGNGEFADYIKDRKNRRVIPHRLEDCRYVNVRNPRATDGLWKINGRRQAIYGLRDLTENEQMTAARKAYRV
jgi:hypothetical protein